MPRQTEEQLRLTFNEFDQDGSGFISRDELVAAMKKVDPDATPEDVWKGIWGGGRGEGMPEEGTRERKEKAASFLVGYIKKEKGGGREGRK